MSVREAGPLAQALAKEVTFQEEVEELPAQGGSRAESRRAHLAENEGLTKSEALHRYHVKKIVHRHTTAGCLTRARVAELYHSKESQLLVAALIVSNFLVQCFRRQIDPVYFGSGDVVKECWWAWDPIAQFFNVMFTFELMVNLYGSWVWPTWLQDYWNVFDCIVVLFCTLDLLGLNGAGHRHPLRLVRVFRVLRLFNRIEALKRILVALSQSIPGVANAGIILLILISIYSVLAVDVFSGTYGNETLKKDPSTGALLANCMEEKEVALTPRGHCFGYEYYGKFTSAEYSFFEIMTGDSWSEAFVRPILDKNRDSDVSQLAVIMFFLSFVFLSSFVMLNVVVTVLLDKFAASETEPKFVPGLPGSFREAFEEMRAEVMDNLVDLRESVQRLEEELTMSTRQA